MSLLLARREKILFFSYLLTGLFWMAEKVWMTMESHDMNGHYFKVHHQLICRYIVFFNTRYIICCTFCGILETTKLNIHYSVRIKRSKGILETATCFVQFFFPEACMCEIGSTDECVHMPWRT